MSLRHLHNKLDRLEALVGPPDSDPQPPRPFADFAATFLKASDKDCSVPLRPVSILHQLIAERLPQASQQRGQRINVLAPRGSAKSMWASFAYPLWCLAERAEEYIVLIADSGTALHRECIVCKLEHTPGWETHTFQSIIEWPKRMDLWQQWESVLHCHDDPDREARARLLYEANREAMEA